MGLRFRKSITLCKGVKLNLGAKSASISVGGKGVHQSFSTTGRTTTTVGVPGTGVSYSKSFNVKKAANNLFGKKDKDGDKKGKESVKKDAKEDAKLEGKASKEQEQQAKAEALAAEREQAAQQVAEFEALIEAVKSVHKVSDEPIDWQEVFDRPAPVAAGVASLRSESKEAYEEWEATHKMAEAVLKGDIDTYLSLIEEVAPYDDLLDFGSEFEVGTDDPEYLEVEFKVKADEVIPTEVLSLKTNGTLSVKEMSRTQKYDLTQDYICSCVLRVAMDTFALLPVKKVLIHAVENGINPATGNEEESTVLSVLVERDKIAALNPERIDPSEAISAMPCHMNFKKTQGMLAVERLSL